MSDDDLIRRGDAKKIFGDSLTGQTIARCLNDVPSAQPAPVTVEEAARVEALEARLNAIAFLARDGACDMKGRRLDEYYDTQMEVTRDPCGAFMAIETMSDALDAIRRAALAGDKP